MATGIASLVQSGSKIWLDSVDPDEIDKNLPRGVTGATSNPSIIADLIASGRFDGLLADLSGENTSDEDLAWAMTDRLVREAQAKFHGTWEETGGDDGWVSFELDPLLEDKDNPLTHEQRVARYIELGKQWNAGHDNRMIKVPATDAGLDALEELAAAGLTLNVTLIFSPRQYELAREAVWRGRQRYGQLDRFKSVYSIFVSRVDVYTQKHVPELSDAAQGKVGTINAKQIGIDNAAWWADKGLKLKQEMIFASTGKKLDWQDEDTYIAELAGSDIQTNPPGTNDALEAMGKTYPAKSRDLGDPAVVAEIGEKVDIAKLEAALMAEGTAKFADPHKGLIQTISEKRGSAVGG